MSKTLDAAIGLVRSERKSQDRRWGADRDLPNRTWLAVLVEEVGEVAKADLEHEGDGRMVLELAQVAAVAVAWIENIMRRPTEPDTAPDG